MNNPNNLRQVAGRLKMHGNVFYVMKATSPNKFNYIQNIDPKNFEKAYLTYIDRMIEAKDRMADIYYYLSDHGNVLKFGKYLHACGIYSHHNSFSTAVGKKIFSSKEGFGSHRGYLVVLNILSVFGEYMTEEMENNYETVA